MAEFVCFFKRWLSFHSLIHINLKLLTIDGIECICNFLKILDNKLNLMRVGKLNESNINPIGAHNAIKISILVSEMH